MKTILLMTAVAMLGVCSVDATANEAVDSTLDLAKRQQTDVKVWTRVAQGMYQGVAADGTAVTVYNGTEGAKLMRWSVARDLAVARANVELASAGGKGNASKTAAFVDEIALLETEYDRLTAIIDHNSRAAASKATQTFDLNTGLFCGQNTSTRARFTNSGALISLGRFEAFGNVSGGGGFPASISRNVFTRTESGGVPVSHSAVRYDIYNPVVSQAMKDEAASCNLRVGHSMSVQCVSGGPFDYFAITRDQTCAGLNAGTPPIVSP